MPLCIKCNREKDASEFVPTKSPYHPKGRSLICLSCLEKSLDSSDLIAVDRLCRWLDIPFLIDQWTRIYKTGKERTLRLYVKILENNSTYQSLDWTTANAKWKAALEAEAYEDLIPEINNEWLAAMERKWPSEQHRTAEDYHYLEDLFNDLQNTQNIVSATQRDEAKRLCELGLQINTMLRAGDDPSRLIKAYHDIVKTEGFEPKHARTVGDFDSVGELYSWLYETGWKPKWHTEPQDSADFTMKAVQNFLIRLVKGEGNIADQVDNRQRQIELAAKLEAEVGIGDYEEEDETPIDYEGEDDLLNDMEEDL